MKLEGNTALITGGGTGIGKAIAEVLHEKGNTVIIAGRRQDVLDETTAANKGIASYQLDISDRDSVLRFADKIAVDFPELNTVIHAAGIMKPEKIGDNDFEVADQIIQTNLVGQISLNSALLPLLLQTHDGGTIMTVSSGLAFLPRADFPTYCATKAAIHSYTQSLRTQLSPTGLRVIELIPPYVQTELTGPSQATDERAMPLDDYIKEVFSILENNPETNEIAVERVQYQRTAEASGEYTKRYKEFNKRLGITTT